MKNKALTTIEVCLPPWSESSKSWYLLTEKGENGSWSNGKWFPKSVCRLDEETGLLTLPEWLYNKIM